MIADGEEVQLSVSGDDVVVVGPKTLADRPARLFFRSVLGASATADGWRCPRRHASVTSVVLRVNTFLEGQGFRVSRVGQADREVEKELERRRSFSRTRDTASSWKAGDRIIDIESVKRQLSEFGWVDVRPMRPHQEQGLAHALVAANAANFSVPGSGKTLTALAVAATHLAAGNIDLILVIGPLACFAPWEHEVTTALGARIRTKRVRGSAGVRRLTYSQVRPGTLLLASFGSAAADRPALIELCRAHNVMLIVDESHRIKRFRGGLWATALVQVASEARVRMILSGTPMPQNGRDLYSQLNVLWPRGEITGGRDSFAARVDANFQSVLRDVYPFVGRTPKSALGLRPYEVHYHQVPLGSLQAEIYHLVASGLRRRIDGAETWQDKIEALRRARPIRLLQAAANPDLFNSADNFYRLPRSGADNPTLMDRLANYRAQETPAKSEAALQLVTDVALMGGKVVCWSNFVANLDQFAGLVRKRLAVTCFQIDGRIPTGDEPMDDQPNGGRSNPDDTDTRERIIDRFLGTKGPAVLVTNPASCSESISLHRGCHHAIYLDRTYDCAQFLQSIDRVHRLGLPPDVTVQIHILLACIGDQPTIDQLVDASLRSKEQVMRSLLEGAELNPIGESVDPSQDADGTTQDLGALLRYLLGEDLVG